MIDKLNRVPKIDNAKKLAKTDSIPENEKYTADEWNERDAKIDELVEQTNVNTLEIIEGYSNLLTNPVDRQRVFIKGVSEADNAKVIKKQGSVSTRGFYRYDLQTDKWYQETSIVEGESIKQGTLTDNQFTDANGDIIEAEEGKLYLDVDSNLFYRLNGADYIQVGGSGSEDTNLGNTNQTIPEGEIREIAVQGRLDIKNLEEKELDDVQFNKVLVQNEEGTLVTKPERQPFNLSFPENVNVKHNYPDFANPNSYQSKITEQLLNLSGGNWVDVEDDFWTVGTLNDQHPEAVELLQNGKGFHIKEVQSLIDVWKSTDKLEPMAFAKSANAIFEPNVDVAYSFDLYFLGFAKNSCFYKLYGDRPLDIVKEYFNQYAITLPYSYNQIISAINRHRIYYFKINNTLTTIIRTYYNKKEDVVKMESFGLPDYPIYMQFDNPTWKLTNMKMKSI